MNSIESKALEVYQTKFDQENGINSIIETLGGADVTQIFVHDISSMMLLYNPIHKRQQLATLNNRLIHASGSISIYINCDIRKPQLF